MLTLYIYVFHQLFTLLAACYVPYEIQINFSLQNVDKDNILPLFQLKYRVQEVSSATQSFKKSTLPSTFRSFNITLFLLDYVNIVIVPSN
jgi:hypothetical protein